MPKFINIPGMLLTAGSNVVDAKAFDSLVTILKNQISVETVVGVIASILVVCVGFAFFWWAVRKVIRMLMSAFKKGKVTV